MNRDTSEAIVQYTGAMYTIQDLDYVLTVWVYSDSEGKTMSLGLGDDQKTISLRIGWQTVERVFTAGSFTLRQRPLMSFSEGVAVDDVVFRPVQSTFQSVSYNSFRQPILRQDNTGVHSITHYDQARRLMAQERAEEIRVPKLTFRHCVSDVSTVPYLRFPNSALSVAFRGEQKVIENLEDSVLDTTEESTVVFSASTLSQESFRMVKGALQLFVEYTAYGEKEGLITCIFFIGGTARKTVTFPYTGVKVAVRHMMGIYNDTLYWFFGAQKVMVEDLPVSADIRGAWQYVGEGSPSVYVVGSEPFFSYQAFDQKGQALQSQILFQEETDRMTLSIQARQNIIDGYGRTCGVTMPILYDLENFGTYQKSLVTSVESKSSTQIGALTGDVVDYYSNEDDLVDKTAGRCVLCI